MILQNGVWVPTLSPRQMEVFNDYHRYLLVHGPRMSSKTWSIVHKMLRHAFDINGARVAMVCRTNKNAKSAGPWVDLTKIAIPEWEAAGIGFKVVEGPAMTGDTRMSYVIIRNRFGTTSEIQLHSLDYCPDVVEKFRGTKFSMFYFSELDCFNDRIVFETTVQQLRMMPQIPYDQHQWIGDTNPPDTGTNNWMHDLWFKELEREDHPDPEYQSRLHQIRFSLDDNVFLDERAKADLKGSLRSKPALYRRWVDGIWEEDLSNGFFSEVFTDAHVLGDIHKPNRTDWDVITPSNSCVGLIAGFDIGDVNHSAHIVEKIRAPDGNHVYAVLDELVSFDRTISVREFTLAFMRLMEKWERYCMKAYNRQINWRCWSDSSAMRWRSAAEATDALIVRNVSGGKIMLQAAPKFNYSVMARVETLHRLLYDKRIFYSAACPKTILMTKALKRGTTKVEPINRNGGHIHVFDSLSYILLAEDPVDIAINGPRVNKANEVSTFTM